MQYEYYRFSEGSVSIREIDKANYIIRRGVMPSIIGSALSRGPSRFVVIMISLYLMDMDSGIKYQWGCQPDLPRGNYAL